MRILISAKACSLFNNRRPQYINTLITRFKTVIGGAVALFNGGRFTGTKAIRLDANGALIGNITTAGSGSLALAGANVGGNGLFYAGENFNSVTRIDINGIQIGTSRSLGTQVRGYLAGAEAGGNGLFYAGVTTEGVGLNTLTIINSDGNIVKPESSVGTRRAGLSGVSVGGNGMFFGGGSTAILTKIDSVGTIVGAETTISGASLYYGAGAAVGGRGLFYGGYIGVNNISIIDAEGTLITTGIYAGTGRQGLAGADVAEIGIFYGGYVNSSYKNTITRIDAVGSMVGIETSITSSTAYSAGAGL